MYDLVIEGGRLFSPADGLDAVGDIGITQGRLQVVGGSLAQSPAEVRVNARGRFVSPGFIDFHVHGYAYNTDYGTYPDDVGVRSGTTTVVDQGSAGALTFPGFREFMIQSSVTRVLAFINIGAVGTIKGSMLPPLHSPEAVDIEATLKTCAQYPDIIRGVKTHAEMGGYSRWGLDVLKLAKEVSRAINRPCYVHTGRLIPAIEERLPHPDTVIPEALEVLEPGDILSHCFTGHPGGIVSTSGRVHPEVVAAIARGLKLDVGYGEHFSFEVAERVLEQGVRPYLLSSDVHALFNEPHSLKATYGLAGAMSRMLALGLPLAEVVDMVTARPAEVLGLGAEIGHLTVGAEADLTIWELPEGDYQFRDPWGVARTGRWRVQPVECVRAGVRVPVGAESTEVQHAG